MKGSGIALLASRSRCISVGSRRLGCHELIEESTEVVDLYLQSLSRSKDLRDADIVRAVEDPGLAGTQAVHRSGQSRCRQVADGNPLG